MNAKAIRLNFATKEVTVAHHLGTFYDEHPFSFSGAVALRPLRIIRIRILIILP